MEHSLYRYRSKTHGKGRSEEEEEEEEFRRRFPFHEKVKTVTLLRNSKITSEVAPENVCYKGHEE